MEECVLPQKKGTLLQGEAPSIAIWPDGLNSQIRLVIGLMNINPALEILKEHNEARACQYHALFPQASIVSCTFIDCPGVKAYKECSAQVQRAQS